jgi:hypothetical protein
MMNRFTLLVALAAAMLASCQRGAAPTAPTSPRPTTPSVPEALIPGVEGEFTLTLTAENSCEQLPLSVRSRTYIATVKRSGSTRFDVDLSGSNFYPYYDSFGIQSHTSVIARFYMMSTFAMDKWLDEIPVIERLTPGGSFAVSGVADVPFIRSVPATPVTFRGEFTYCPTPVDQADPYPPACRQPVTCKSDKHTLSLTRR